MTTVFVTSNALTSGIRQCDVPLAPADFRSRLVDLGDGSYAKRCDCFRTLDEARLDVLAKIQKKRASMARTEEQLRALEDSISTALRNSLKGC